MNRKRGLMNPANPCHCRRKTNDAIRRGLVNPQSLLFSTHHVRTAKQAASERIVELGDLARMAALFRTLSTTKGNELVLFVKSALAGFLGSMVANTISAMAVLQPLVNKEFGVYTRTEEQGLNFPALMLGYLVFGGVMAYIYPRMKLEGHWLRKGLIVGLSIGFVMSFGGHMITAGWSMLPARPMAISGLIDTLANAVGGIGIAYLHRHK